MELLDESAGPATQANSAIWKPPASRLSGLDLSAKMLALGASMILMPAFFSI